MRLLKALVIAMGVVLVLGFGAVIFIVINRMNGPRPESALSLGPPQVLAPQPTPAPAEASTETAALPGQLGQSLPAQFTPNFGDRELALPAGARLSDFSAGGDRLVLRVILPDQGQQLMVVDLKTGALIGTLKLSYEDESKPASVLPLLPSVLVPPRNRQEGGK